MPRVPPAAPHAENFADALWARIIKNAADTLTIALTICSKIWEIAVGIMVFLPWKRPRSVPIIATTKMVGARIRSGMEIP